MCNKLILVVQYRHLAAKILQMSILHNQNQLVAHAFTQKIIMKAFSKLGACCRCITLSCSLSSFTINNTVVCYIAAIRFMMSRSLSQLKLYYAINSKYDTSRIFYYAFTAYSTIQDKYTIAISIAVSSECKI